MRYIEKAKAMLYLKCLCFWYMDRNGTLILAKLTDRNRDKLPEVVNISCMYHFTKKLLSDCVYLKHISSNIFNLCTTHFYNYFSTIFHHKGKNHKYSSSSSITFHFKRFFFCTSNYKYKIYIACVCIYKPWMLNVQLKTPLKKKKLTIKMPKKSIFICHYF